MICQVEPINELQKSLFISFFLPIPILNKSNKMTAIVQCTIFFLLFDLISSHENAVTCNSTFKLINQYSGDRLHSHDIKYGTGSGQQVCHVYTFSL